MLSLGAGLPPKNYYFECLFKLTKILYLYYNIMIGNIAALRLHLLIAALDFLTPIYNYLSSTFHVHKK